MVRAKIGIMGAMYEEVASLINLLDNITLVEGGMRIYYCGQIGDTDVVVVFSRWGKVAAAATAAHLILGFGVGEILFTGLSGAIAPHLHIGDIVVADKLYQHDMDATPLFSRFEVPMLGQIYIAVQEQRVADAAQKLAAMLGSDTHKGWQPVELASFGLHKPRLHVGAIASGDTFFKEESSKLALAAVLPDVLCVEMEGASVAQVCHEYKIPFTIVRTIADDASHESVAEFAEFAKKAAGVYSLAIVSALLGVPHMKP